MSSSRRALLFAALCTPLLAALFAPLLTTFVRAEKPTDPRSTSRNDSRSTSSDTAEDIPNKIGGKTYDEWKKDLEHKDPSVRSNTIRVIPSFGVKAESAVPILVARTHDQDASCRVKAVIAFQFMAIRGTDRVRVVKALGERISSDPQAIVRYEAAKALRRFGPDGREVVADLVRGVGDSGTYELREACIIALIVAGVDPTKGPDVRVTDALILRSKAGIEPTTQVRLEAIIALGAMGRPQDPKKLAQVFGALKQNFLSPNKIIKIWAHVSVMALEDKVDKTYLKTIADYLKDPERDIRVQAVTALGALKDKAQDYLPDMLKLFRAREDSEVVIAASQALGHMGNKGPRVLQALINQTEKTDVKDVPIILAAASALAQLAPEDAEVVAALQKVRSGGLLTLQQKETLRLAIEDGKKAKIDDTKPKARIENPKLNTGATGRPNKTR
ncbi:MAG TPA: HEAT repeat domain-containing protein [Gemmataceae bacterium]|nr:HEAT repeat domain-containing protein [Gemmataceae bacterium]